MRIVLTVLLWFVASAQAQYVVYAPGYETTSVPVYQTYWQPVAVPAYWYVAPRPVVAGPAVSFGPRTIFIRLPPPPVFTVGGFVQ